MEAAARSGTSAGASGRVFRGYRTKRYKDGSTAVCERWISLETHQKELAWKREYNRAYYQRNKERLVPHHAQWKKDNPEKFAAHRRTYMRTNPHARIGNSLRRRVARLLGASQSRGRYRKLIGCSPQDLMLSLECRFEPGMTWQNYGSAWHIDHILPLSSYDLTDPAQQREAFHYTNLQPLWASANMAKSDTVEGEDIVLGMLAA
jgi:hypothetical protein